MSKKKRAVAPQQSIKVRLRWIDTTGKIANTAIAWGGAVMITYWGFRSIEVLSGHSTFADIGVRVLANVSISKAVAWLFGCSGVVYGIKQRRLRRDTIENLQARIKLLEKTIDSKRTTSGLTVRGETREEDK